MAPNVLRRYTPPTCTLEILAQQSPLSRWAGQTVLKHLRFQLRFDDPKLPQEEWLSVTGDRTQLEELWEVTQDYVQAFLQQSQIRLGNVLQPLPAIANGVADSPEAALAEADASQGNGPTLSLVPPAKISLEPAGLLTHRLHLASLAPVPGQTINLSTLQLFDLADALDQYAAESVTLPNLSRQRRSLIVPNWGQVAAMAVLAVGLTTSLLRMTDASLRAKQQEQPTSSQGASSRDQRIANQLPPSAVSPPSPLAPLAGLPNVALPPLGSTLPDPLPSLQPSPNPTTSPGQKPEQTQGKQGTIANLQKVPVQRNTPTNAPTTVTIDQMPGAESAAASRSTGPSAVARSANPPAAPAVTVELPSPSLKAPSRSDLGTAADLQPARENTSAFDVIPQVAEARDYFAARWKPPTQLPQSLEYTIQVDAEGKVMRIIPLTEASGQFIDYSEIPPAGEALVSPLKKGKSARIRLVLGVDGKVQALLEGLE